MNKKVKNTKMKKNRQSRSPKPSTKAVQERKKVQGSLKGLVVAASQPKTATVLVERRKTHPLYGKSFRRSKRYLVHDELGTKEGDVVEIVQIKPISKNKHFKVARVVGQDLEAAISEQLKEEAEEQIAKVIPAEESKVEQQEVSQKETKGKEEPKTKGRKKGEKSSP